DALAQYRAIAASGGWPNVPASKKGATIEAKDSRLPVLVKRLAAEDTQFAAIKHPSTDNIREAVKRFQGRNGLEADGHLGSDRLAALNVSPAARAATIAANMERWRWVPHTFERRYVAVNVPDESVSYVRDGEVVLSSKVIIGRKANPTPIARTEITGIIANP